MAGAASAHQAATASREQNSQQRAGRTRRTSADPQRAQQGATAAAAAAPAALDSLSRLQQLADASPQVAQLRRLQALADARFAAVAQLAGGPEEEELVQGKLATAQLQPQLQQAPRTNNTGLPDQLKSGIESLSGLSMDHVRVHYNSSQPAQLNALAYAQGSDIHLAPGQERHLPHEAWHVVQQAQGRVRPTMQMKERVPVNDDVGLEREADVMGAMALQTKAATASDGQSGDIAGVAASPVIQGYFTYGGRRQRNLNAEIASIFMHSEGFLATLNEYQRIRDSGEEIVDLGIWFYQQIEQRGWQDTSVEPRGALGISISQFIAAYATDGYAVAEEPLDSEMDSLSSKMKSDEPMLSEPKSESSGKEKKTKESEFRSIPIRIGLIHGTYDEETNTADLHVDAKGSGGGLSVKDMYEVALCTHQLMTHREESGGPKGRFMLHPTGAAIVKIVAELLGEALGGNWSKSRAKFAQFNRKRSGKGGAKSFDKLDKSVLPEHFRYLDSVRGTGAVEIVPRIVSATGKYKPTEDDYNQDMMSTTKEGDKQYQKYSEALQDEEEPMGPGLDVTIYSDQLPAIIAILKSQIK
jgi:hypothetical protein